MILVATEIPSAGMGATFVPELPLVPGSGWDHTAPRLRLVALGNARSSLEGSTAIVQGTGLPYGGDDSRRHEAQPRGSAFPGSAFPGRAWVREVGGFVPPCAPAGVPSRAGGLLDPRPARVTMQEEDDDEELEDDGTFEAEPEVEEFDEEDFDDDFDYDFDYAEEEDDDLGDDDGNLTESGQEPEIDVDEAELADLDEDEAVKEDKEEKEEKEKEDEF